MAGIAYPDKTSFRKTRFAWLTAPGHKVHDGRTLGWQEGEVAGHSTSAIRSRDQRINECIAGTQLTLSALLIFETESLYAALTVLELAMSTSTTEPRSSARATAVGSVPRTHTVTHDHS